MVNYYLDISEAEYTDITYTVTEKNEETGVTYVMVKGADSAIISRCNKRNCEEGGQAGDFLPQEK